MGEAARPKSNSFLVLRRGEEVKGVLVSDRCLSFGEEVLALLRRNGFSLLLFDRLAEDETVCRRVCRKQ